MGVLYAPFRGEEIVPITVNGHRMVVLSPTEDTFEENLSDIGADSVKEIFVGDTKEEQKRLISSLAQSTSAGVVIAPMEADLKEIVESLSEHLPWLH